jgi:PIN like domain
MSFVRRRSGSPADAPEFFTDIGLGKRVVDGLRAEAWAIQAMYELYPSAQRGQGARRRARFLDENWIPEVTQRGLVILSKDGFRWPHERMAIAESGARVFMIPNANLRAEYMIERFVASREAIWAHCEEAGPFLFSVHPTSLHRVTLPDV